MSYEKKWYWQGGRLVERGTPAPFWRGGRLLAAFGSLDPEMAYHRMPENEDILNACKKVLVAYDSDLDDLKEK